MTWHLKYWDTLDQLYWNPSLLGLTSIPKSELAYDNGRISIPGEHVRNGGSIYTRKGTAIENAARMRRLEEPLNHIFDITFAIAPDNVIRSLFAAPLAFEDKGIFERLGREISVRYPGFANSNTTQQDAFFVSADSLIGVELKLGSKTWPGQVLKYLALMFAEEKLSGNRTQIGLLYVTPNESIELTLEQAGADPSGILPDNFLDMVPSKQINKSLARMLTKHHDHFQDAAQRLRLAHMSWRELLDRVSQIAANQDMNSTGGETLYRLMQGFAEAIASQNGCLLKEQTT